MKIKNSQFKIKNYKAGMTYVELIVVLTIFSVMSSIIIFNYGAFQDQIDTKNLTNNIALKFVQAQKAALSGLLPPAAQQTLIQNPATWKPSYGVYINRILDVKSFIYFSDLDQNGNLSNPNCFGIGECLEKISITKGASISSLDVFFQGDATAHSINDLTVTFARPNSGAVIHSSTAFGSVVSYVQVTILSQKNYTAKIKIYPSGRIQIN
jgi:prepilin-type N-terminal cleavage/methylation domain-containing protein